MPADLTAIRQTGIIAGFGGSIVIISIFVLVVTLYDILNGLITYGDNVPAIVISIAGIVTGTAILAASLLQPTPKKSF